MGYETIFDGALDITPKLEEKHRKYLDAFRETRRMQRDPKIVATMDDPLREAVGLPVGPEGDFYVGDADGRTPDIIDYNKHPSAQCSLWCGWYPYQDGTRYIADDGKNCAYVKWLKYIIDNFLIPWGYKLNGEVKWEGEEQGDVGKIVVKDNEIKVLRVVVSYEEW